MPNWCSNFVQITHPDSDRIQALAEAARKGRFCEHIIPTPAELREHSAPEYDEARAEEFLAKYGYTDWYSFCVARWGTKWDVDPYDNVEVQPHYMSFGFDSAWSPPIGIYEALVADGFTVDAMYYEPGMGFCGRWVDGSDDYTELSGLSSAQAAEIIDPDVDLQFGIVENMEAWESEQEEEEENEGLVRKHGNH